jgi:hypothetical protein
MSQVFYGRTIVAVGFLAHIASAFSISSTLRVFLKPLGVSRGVFSLIRSGEVLISAVAAIVRARSVVYTFAAMVIRTASIVLTLAGLLTLILGSSGSTAR